MSSSSSSYNASIATDNRQAATDSAFVQRGGNAAFAAPIFNLNASANSSSKKTSSGFKHSGGGNSSGGTSKGGTINLSVLDGGAIANSFQFADNALSQVLSSVLETEKLQASTNEYQANAIGAALTEAAAQNKAAADGALEWIENNFKNLMGFAVIGLAGWYFIKGR